MSTEIKGYVVRWDEIRDGKVVGSLFSAYGPSAVDGRG